MLSEEAIKKYQEVYKKNYGKDITYEEAAEAGRNLVNLYEVLLKSHLREERLEAKLKDFPKGFSIMDGKTYSCSICHSQIKDEQLWYDKWGRKCFACQDAVNKKKIPGSICRNEKDWYATWELGMYFKIKAPVVSKLVRQGILKARIVPKSGFKVFLIKENIDVLPPKDIVDHVVVPVKGKERTMSVTPWYEAKDPKKTLEKYKIWSCLTELQNL